MIVKSLMCFDRWYINIYSNLSVYGFVPKISPSKVEKPYLSFLNNQRSTTFHLPSSCEGSQHAVLTIPVINGTLTVLALSLQKLVTAH